MRYMYFGWFLELIKKRHILRLVFKLYLKLIKMQSKFEIAFYFQTMSSKIKQTT